MACLLMETLPFHSCSVQSMQTPKTKVCADNPPQSALRLAVISLVLIWPTASSVTTTHEGKSPGPRQ